MGHIGSIGDMRPKTWLVVLNKENTSQLAIKDGYVTLFIVPAPVRLHGLLRRIGVKYISLPGRYDPPDDLPDLVMVSIIGFSDFNHFTFLVLP